MQNTGVGHSQKETVCAVESLILCPGKRTASREHYQVEVATIVKGERRSEQRMGTIRCASAYVLYVLAAYRLLDASLWVPYTEFGCPDDETGAKAIYKLRSEFRTGIGAEIPIENDRHGGRRLLLSSRKIVIWPTMLNNLDNQPVRELVLKAFEKQSGKVR